MYELDDIIQRLSEGQRYSRKLFDLMDKLDFEVKGTKVECDHKIILEYVERLMYE